MRSLRFLLQNTPTHAKVGGMNIAVLGAGALGCYYGARLAEAGHNVTFIARSAAPAMKEHGLHVQSVHGDISLPRPLICTRPEECGPVDLVLVCWKTTANSNLPTALPPLVKDGTEIVTLQNGMGNGETIAQIVPASRVFIGLCFVCCMMDTPGVIRHLEGGDIQVAPLIPTESGLARAQELAGLFRQAHIRSRAALHAEQILWCKLTWNIPFNGLCLAHGGISVRQLFTMPGEVERAQRIMEEVCLTAEKRGFPLPMDLVHEQMERTRLMGDFIPSSAVDYNRKRPVEYQAIWGATLERAHEAQSPVPYWEQLCQDILHRLGQA